MQRHFVLLIYLCTFMILHIMEIIVLTEGNTRAILNTVYLKGGKKMSYQKPEIRVYTAEDILKMEAYAKSCKCFSGKSTHS